MDHIIWMIIVGIIAGWLAGLIWKGSGFGIVVDLVVGIVGAVLGGWLFAQLGISLGGIHPLVGSIIVAVIGALLLLFVVKQLKKT